MDKWNRHLTALLRARYYREKQPDDSTTNPSKGL
jgi:hypothetical protein